MGAIGLIGPVAATFGFEIVLQAPPRRPQSRRSQARNVGRVSPTILVKLAFGLKQPTVSALHPSDDPLLIKLMLCGRPDILILIDAIAR
jgi:hypothetical protein